LNIFCQAYLDDILIYNKIKEKYREYIRLILDKLKRADLQINIHKCEFDIKETIFLKVIISDNKLRIDLAKVEAIQRWTTPTNLKQIQGFLGFANFYRRFIEEFSKSMASLVALTKKKYLFV